MYAIEEGVVKINEVTVDTFKREADAGSTVLSVEAGTTGFKGGCCRDAGGRTYLGIDCLRGDFCFHPVTNENGDLVGIEIACCGDDGLNAIMKALDFFMKVLSDECCEVDD
jgi:hypothetical protein